MKEYQEKIWALEARFSVDDTEPDEGALTDNRPLDYKDSVTAYHFLSNHYFLRGNSSIARNYYLLAEETYQAWYLQEIADTKGKLDGRTEQDMARIRKSLDRIAETRGYKVAKKKIVGEELPVLETV